MSEIVVYDKAAWHIEGDFPEDLAERNAYTHSGLYLGWLINRDLVSEEFLDDWSDEIELFRKRERTAPALFEITDGVLESSMLSDDGARFTGAYFNLQEGRYLDDYESLLVNELPTMYHAEDTWANFDKLAARLDERFAQWDRKKRGPWWRFWAR